MHQYRGRRKDTGEWVYGYLIGSDVIVGEIVQFCDEYFNTEFWWRVDPKTVGKSTGLKDKNGKEIYEGDIVTRGDGNFKVIYKQDRHYIGWVATDRNEASYIHIWYDGLEVIGNIYENPELLKGAEA